MKQINFATTNEYKIKHANVALNKHGWEAIQTKVELIEPQSMSQEDVAIFKAKQAYDQVKKTILIQDSGIFINSLGGFPGIYTKFMLDNMKNKHIFAMLDTENDRTAYIQQTIVYYDGNTLKTFIGRSEGTIILENTDPDKSSYDLYFMPKGFGKIKANLTEEEKVEAWGYCWNDLAIWLGNYSEN